MSITPKSLINDSGTVPSLPLIYEEITNTINDPNSSTSAIGDVISKDSGLTARLLRIANSALYNFPSTIDTISHAVIVIGIQQLRDLALGTSVVELFEGIADDLVNMNSFWRHSIACGIAARILATYRREANVERYFVAGVLHDIGRLIIYLKLPDQARECLVRCKSSGELLHRVEKEILGFDHGEVGGVLLDYWKLPTTLIESVTHHHQPMHSTRFPVEACVIHVADLIANAMQLGSSGERLVPPLSSEAWERIGLSPSVLAPTLNEVDRQFGDAVETFLKHSGK